MSFLRLLLSVLASLFGTVLLIPLFIILTPFWIISIFFKIIEKSKPKISDWEETIAFDSHLGWRPKPNLKVHMESDGMYRLSTGPDGWRGKYSLKESDTVVIGDSFVFGHAVDDADHFASLTKLARVKPIGAPSYGALHYLLLLKTLTVELKGKLVIWFVYGNDYGESVHAASYGYRFPFVFLNRKSGAWEVKTDHIQPMKLPFHFDRGYKTSMPELADLFSKNYFSDYAFGAFEYLAEEAKKHCNENGAEFVIVTIPIRWLIDGSYVSKIKRHTANPENFSLEYVDEQIGHICKRHNIIFRPCLKEFVRSDFLPNDLHWSRQGNKKAAKIIDELYQNFLKKTSPKTI